jgi:hypothetical protein
MSTRRLCICVFVHPYNCIGAEFFYQMEIQIMEAAEALPLVSGQISEEISKEEFFNLGFCDLTHHISRQRFDHDNVLRYFVSGHLFFTPFPELFQS